MKKSTRRLFISAVMVLLLILFSGCAANGQDGSATPNAPDDSDVNVSQPNDGEETNVQEAEGQVVRAVAHAMGSTNIEGTPEKVVTLFQGATDAAILLGVKPVGAVEAWIEKPWYNYIRDEMEGAVNLGSENQPDLEAIIALQPDVIIASKTRHENISEQLSAIAPTVMTEEVHIWKDTLALTAEALNKQAEEELFLQEWDAKVAEFKEKAGDLLNLEAGIVDFRADHARIVYTGFSALVISELGIPRPASQQGEEWGIQLASKESILQMDADIIFDQTSMDREDGRIDLKKEWQEHPLWQSLQAVQNDRVYEVDTAVWNNGSGPLAAMEMLNDLYEIYGLQ